MLSLTQAARFADIALANVVREYPNKQDHVLEGDGDHLPSRLLHPAFHGSFDWHSCVHMHWLLVHVRRCAPDLPQRDAIEALLDRHLTPAAIDGEVAYLARPGAGSFERTYGWAWLLKLADELALTDDASARRWAAALAPLAAAFVARYAAFLPKADFPIRYGIHPNSAFGLAFALDHARRAELPALEAMIVTKARTWYRADRDAPASWEPSGSDFLSPALVEANLMRRVLPAPEFAVWLELFLPGLAVRVPATLFTPVKVSDRADPQIGHLDGLNLSRAWCWRGIAGALPADDARVPVCRTAWADHLAAGLAALDAGDYGGSHWLASFAALALAD
ncbi:MAG TPA: DUF2891 domain-containing protein [Casimicrobiaceae bacterium]